VSVATVWSAPEKVRPVDAPALATPADPAGWVAAMSHEDKLDLLGRAETQVLYGDPVELLGETGDWSQVRVPGQAHGPEGGGYPGWLPTRQLTGCPSPAPDRVVATARLTHLYADPNDNAPLLELSFGTAFPVADRTAGWVEVTRPGGGTAWLPEADLAPLRSGHTTGAELLATASFFVGLPYLWAGVSAYGFDCSGLVHAVHRRHGLAIPRDADDQARAGRPLPLGGLEPGDLLFFAHDDGRGEVHHVAMFAGDGTMLHAPETGRTVEVVPVESRHYGRELCAARRYLPMHAAVPPGGGRRTEALEEA
jgi:cell wall-associated NlpC family hydrolase